MAEAPAPAAAAVKVYRASLAASGHPGRQTAPPKPAPRDANGRAILGGENPKDKGLWLPVFGILDPILAVPKGAVSAVGHARSTTIGRSTSSSRTPAASRRASRVSS